MQFDEHKRNRADLAGYFVKNAIPTEANFSDLIASGLNQRDDGIAKPADGAVSLQGADERGLRRVLNLYRDFSDDMPSWTLSVEGTGNGGLGIGRGSDDSVRLFVDNTTGNVGVNTVTPQSELDVNGSLRVTGTLQPSAGNPGGIDFPHDPFGGGGDRAWIRYVARDGENTTFEIGTSNDIGDHIALVPSGSVGVGTSSPDQTYKLDVRGSIAAGNSDLYFTGTSHTHTGYGNASGHAAIENDSNAYNALMILGRTIPTFGVNFVRRINMYDEVYIASKLTVNGTVVSTSDARLKEDVEEAPYGLDVVNRLRPVTFSWRDRPDSRRSIGLLAQDVREVLGEVVHGDEEAGESLGVSYPELIPVLVNAIQELDRRVAALTADAKDGAMREDGGVGRA